MRVGWSGFGWMMALGTIRVRSLRIRGATGAGLIRICGPRDTGAAVGAATGFASADAARALGWAGGILADADALEPASGNGAAATGGDALGCCTIGALLLTGWNDVRGMAPGRLK